jgi:hypothetical protein
MVDDALPRPAAKYLASLPPARREKITAVLDLVRQALAAGADTEIIVQILADHPFLEPEDELALLEVLARLSHPLIPEILQARFGGTLDKTCQKALKKAFHLLQTQGIVIPPDLVKIEAPGLFKPVAVSGQIKGYASRIEGNGSRLVILQLPRQATQSFNLFLALCSDVEGLKDTYAVLLSNKEAKKYLANTKEDIPGELIDLPPAHVFRILEESYQANPDQASDSVVAYLRVRPVLANWLGQEAAPDIHGLLPPLEALEPYLQQSKNLSLKEDFAGWHFRPEELGSWLQKIKDIEKSPLVLTPDQKVARIENLMAEAVNDLFPLDKRHLLSRRLLEMAYYLDRTGKPHLARQAQAAGLDLERERSPLERENPFLLGLLMFPLKEMYDQEVASTPEKSQPQGHILTDF